jgi:hypothetical protein
MYETPLNWSNGKTYSVLNGGLSPGIKVLVANGNDEAPNPHHYIWQETINVTSNTNYDFSFWTRSTGGPGDPHPNLNVKINGVSISSINPTNPQWVKYQTVWNSGGATTATITITDLTLSLNGNDFELDKIVFNTTAYSVCESTEVDDCGGYLEKKINPYIKGLLGNFRGYRNMIFYGERTETDPTAQTNLPANGFLTGFNTYWNFNVSNNLVPDVNNPKWVWNTQSTRFNSKGMELETKDALGIYTSAQYGYKKTLPVAIANNSMSGEMFYEGFEDNNYDDLLNSSVYNSCAAGYIDFNGLEGTEIGDAQLYGIKAHTGNKVVRIDANDTLIKTFNVQTPNNAFELKTTPATSTALYDFGGLSSCSTYPDNSGSCSVSFGNLSSYGYTSGTTSATEFEYGGEFTTTQYTQVSSYGLYSFDMGVKLMTNSGMTGTAVYTLHIEDLNGITLGEKQLTCTQNVWGIEVCNDGLSLYLCTGVYKITTSYTVNFVLSAPIYFQFSFSSEAWYNCSANLPSYKSLNSQSSCTFTNPISAKDSMMNPIFSMPSGKKMVFSAWVRESNTQVLTYNDNEVQIDFGGSPAILKPTGPIIDGWQRYEGYFTPSGGGTVNLKLINNSGSPIYFDDIRIHPFNSNLKSYVYDPVNLRLKAELDANNYASFYEYDEEGTLIRTKVETREGIKTVTESRSAKQKNITDFQ